MRLSTQAMRAAALTVVAGVAALACGGSSTTGGNAGAMAPASQQIYRVNSGTEPNSWDPGQQTYTYEANLGRNVFEPLLRPKQDLSDVEGLTADRWSVSADGLTYTFHIRTTAMYSDGVPVKAQDFVYAWKRILNPALAAGYTDPFFDTNIAGGANYSNVSTSDAGAITSFLNGLGLSAPDAHTFVVKLAHPANYFKWVATLWVGAPIRQDKVDAAAGGSEPAVTDATKLEAWAQTPTAVVGNGPFMIQSEVPKDHVTLVPNPHAWNKPTLQQLSFYFIEDANQSFAKYQTGELDQISVPLADTKTVENDPKYKNQLLKISTLSPFWIAFNDQKAPLTNPLVRKALTESVDKNKLCVDVDQGQCTALNALFPKGFPLYDANEGKGLAFNVTQAKADLAASGVSVADINQLKLITRSTTGNITRNTFLVNQWQTNLGLNIQLQTIDSKTVTRDIRKAQFDIYFADGWGFDYPDAQDIADIFETAACHGLNWGCWNNAQYDSLVMKADASTNQSERNTLYKQAEDLLVKNAVVGFMFQSLEIDLVKSYVHIKYTSQDDEFTPGDFFYDQAYIIKH
jgi:oligopeptide transport system substrate-binding protein